MEQILRWLAGMGSDPLPAGESLRFEFLSLPKGGLGLAAVVGFLAIAIGTFLIYRRDAARLSLGQRATLAVLRLLALASVAFLLLEPSLVKVRKVVRPGEVLVFVDASQSMSHRDSYARSADWAAGWREIGLADPAASTRMSLATKALAQEGLLPALAKRNRIRTWLFGGAARPAPELGSKVEATKPGAGGQDSLPGRLPPAPALDFAKFEPSDGSTNLTASLRQGLEASRDARVAAVVILSDGRRNAGGSPEEAGALLRRRKVPEVWVVGVGDPAETWSVVLREVQVAERVFKGDPLTISAVVVSQGYGQQSLTVRLTEVDAHGTKVRELATAHVDVGGERSSALAKFDPITLDSKGEHLLRVAVVPPAGEPLEEERHAKTHRVEVLSERLRVLMIAGAPTHEYRFLRDQLIRDNTIDVSCWLQSADRAFPQDGNTKLKELPTTPRELDAYDAILMLDPDPQLLAPELIQNIRVAVEERGTGLWYVMGEKFSLAAVRPGSPLTSVIRLLPVVPDLAAAEDELQIGKYFKRKYPWKLTTEGKEHRVTSLVPDPVVNENRWSHLPGFYWSFPVARAKPAARVLVRHADERLRSQGGTRPILAIQFVGAGRVLYTGTDEVYRWRSVAKDDYNKFWVKGLRWLYEGKLTGGSSRFRLGASADRITLGQDVEIYLRALDQSYEPLVAESALVRLRGPGKLARELTLQRDPVGEGRYRGDFRPSAIGTWSVTAVSDEGNGTEGAGRPVRFEVIRSELESKGPMGLAELSRFAASAGGALVTPKQLLARAETIKSASTTETFTLPFALWDSWIALGLVLVFLTAEWILRKRFDLV